MKYALGNMLNGAGGLNADGLSLDLQFAADKTLTARKGPTPTFLRASGATQVNAAGLIEWAPENIILQSENFSAASWSKFGSTISSDFAAAPDGTITADKLVESTLGGVHGTFQGPTTTSGVTHIGSCYIKAAGRNFAVVYTGAAPANGRYISIPADGTGTVLGLSNANPSNVTLQYVGDGWYRVSILIVSSGSGSTFEVYTAISGTNNSYTGNGTSGVLVWGAQLERSSTARAYIPTTTAAVYAPRFDHDPLTQACKGLLIEESRTNLVFPSDTLTTQTRTVTAVAHTLSFYGTGTVALSGTHIATVVGTGAYPTRTTLTFTPTAGSLTLTVTGSVTQAQLELGSFPTSYIPTTTASVIRSADVCSITGSAFSGMWNANEGTIYAAHYQYGATGFAAILTADGGSDTGKVQIGRIGTTQGYCAIKDASNIEVFTYGPTSSLIAGRNKSALAYKQNDSIATINNLSSSLDTSVALGTQTQLLIGNDSISRRHNGAIDSIRVYKKRLSLAKLQALTV